MDNRTRDAIYLNEFAQFTGFGPITASTAIYSALRTATAERNYDAAAHLVARLNVEMLMAMECAAALFYAYSRWNHPQGVLGTLVSYDSRSLRTFVESLLASETPTRLLKFPPTETLASVSEDSAGIRALYTEVNVGKLVRQTCGMFANSDIRNVYNRTKHGMVYSRHLQFLVSDASREDGTSMKFLHRSATHGVFDVSTMQVTGTRGRATAKMLFNNTCVVAKHSRDIATFVALALQRDLMER